MGWHVHKLYPWHQGLRKSLINSSLSEWQCDFASGSSAPPRWLPIQTRSSSQLTLLSHTTCSLRQCWASVFEPPSLSLNFMPALLAFHQPFTLSFFCSIWVEALITSTGPQHGWDTSQTQGCEDDTSQPWSLSRVQLTILGSNGSALSHFSGHPHFLSVPFSTLCIRTDHFQLLDVIQIQDVDAWSSLPKVFPLLPVHTQTTFQYLPAKQQWIQDWYICPESDALILPKSPPPPTRCHRDTLVHAQWFGICITDCCDNYTCVILEETKTQRPCL